MSHPGFWVSKSQIVGEASPRGAATASKADTHGDEPPPRRPPRPRRGAQAAGGEAAAAARCGRFARERVRGEPGASTCSRLAGSCVGEAGCASAGERGARGGERAAQVRCGSGGIARAAVSEEDRVSFSSNNKKKNLNESEICLRHTHLPSFVQFS